ncbi:MAG: tetratricopeptide repeat protein [Acidobacteria bacterium]|nr:tetratricopeptide repeat protein [Acidobacteriota bacterium]
MTRHIQLRAAATLALAGGLVSCTRTQVVKTAAPPPAPVSVWDRQVRNALDAGEGDYRLRALRERVAAEPGNVAVRVELAAAYRDRGYPEIALEISRLAVARFPESGDAELSLVRDLRATGHSDQAASGLETYLKAHPASGAAYWSWLGILRDEMGLWPSGEPAHRKAIEVTPDADYLHNNLGYNLLMQTKYEAAAGEFREALKLNPRNVTARNNLATALANSNAPAQAIATWQSATDPASAHNNLAAVWIEKGNYADARKELDLALGYNRAHPAALKNLELLSRVEGRPATLPAASASAGGRWQRFRAGFKKLFVGPLDGPPNSKEGAATTAASR